MSTESTINAIFSVLIPLFGLIFSIIAFFLKKIIEKIDLSYQASMKSISEIEKVNLKLFSMEKDIEKALIMGENAKNLDGEIEILKRDLKTCFTKVDQLNERLNSGK